MNFGISSACFYPELTEKSVDVLVQNKIPEIELFFDSDQELNTSYARKIKSGLGNTKVVSVHPFPSVNETMLFFSNYERRFEDGVELYKRYFHFCNVFGAKYIIFHGVDRQSPTPWQVSFERFGRLSAEAKKHGIVLLQENVVRCKSGTVDFIKDMSKQLGDDVAFVLDTKQSLRARQYVTQMIDAMGSKLKHIHISDHDKTHDCLPPGLGDVDFAQFSNKLKEFNYLGSIIIELYTNSYENQKQLIDSYEFLKREMTI